MRYEPFISFPSEMKAWREYFLSLTAVMLLAMLMPPALVPYMATGVALSRLNESKRRFTTTRSSHRKSELPTKIMNTVCRSGTMMVCCSGQMPFMPSPRR